MPVDYRILLDVPYNFPVEPGYQKATHCMDFHPGKGAFQNTWQCPKTKVVMLKPSFFDPHRFGIDFKALGEWNHKPGFWEEVVRAAPSVGTDADAHPKMITNNQAAGADPTLIETVTDVSIIQIEREPLRQDALYWCLESKFTLPYDGGWVIYTHTLSDEFARKNNWFGVLVDNLFLHFSQTGVIRAYEYVDRNFAASPVLRDEFEIASPGDLLNRANWFMVIPIPPIGIGVYHGHAAHSLGVNATNSFAEAAPHSHVIPWKARKVGGNNRFFENSTVKIAINPWRSHVLGFQAVTYPEVGTFTDAPFNPPYHPNHDPDTQLALALETGVGTATAELRNIDDVVEWHAASDHKGRVRVTLTRDDETARTPFVQGYFCAWLPIFQTRNTLPVETTRILSLEWSDDEYLRFEATARVLIDNPAVKEIARRGDCTFELYRSTDGGVQFDFLEGGLARVGKIETVRTGTGTHYEVPLTMNDMWIRFKESNQTNDNAFDGLSMGQAINNTLFASGFGPLATIPPEVAAVLIPQAKDGKPWKYAPKATDTGDDILRVLLFLLRTQGGEWRMRFDWRNVEWTIERKPLSYDGFNFVANPADELRAFTFVRYLDLEMDPDPPEVNILNVSGNTDIDGKGEMITVDPIYNIASFSDPTSPDYLGRAKVFSWTVLGVSDKGEVSKCARRINDAAGHHRMKGKVVVPDLTPGLVPTTFASIWDFDFEPEMHGWIKKRTVVWKDVDYEEVTYTVDTIWAGELRKEQ